MTATASTTKTVKTAVPTPPPPKKPARKPVAPQARPDRNKARQDDDGLTLAPHSVELEENVLGALLMSPDVLTDVKPVLTPESFFILRHGWVYEAALAVDERGDGVDIRTIAEELKARGRLDDVGGEAYLNYLPTTTPTALHAEVYARLIDRYATRRKLIGAAGEIVRLAHDTEKDVTEVIEASETALFAVSEQRLLQAYTPISRVVADYWDSQEIKRDNPEAGLGIPTGFYDLDNLLGGLHNDDLIIVAGRPGQGKTAFLLSTALNAARLGARIAIHSMEMSALQLMQRLMAIETGISSQELQRGQVTDAQWARFVEASGRIAALPIWFDDSASLSPQQLRTKTRRLHREVGLDLILVDGLWLMNDGGAAGKNANSVQRVTYITRAMKELSRELHRPIVMAHQLNRDLEKRADKRPQLSDLRESGSAEQDTDVVMMLYRDEYYNEATERPGECDVIVAKHRNGPTGTITLLFQKEATKFVNMKRISL